MFILSESVKSCSSHLIKRWGLQPEGQSAVCPSIPRDGFRNQLRYQNPGCAQSPNSGSHIRDSANRASCSTLVFTIETPVYMWTMLFKALLFKGQLHNQPVSGKETILQWWAQWHCQFPVFIFTHWILFTFINIHSPFLFFKGQKNEYTKKWMNTCSISKLLSTSYASRNPTWFFLVGSFPIYGPSPILFFFFLT